MNNISASSRRVNRGFPIVGESLVYPCNPLTRGILFLAILFCLSGCSPKFWQTFAEGLDNYHPSEIPSSYKTKPKTYHKPTKTILNYLTGKIDEYKWDEEMQQYIYMGSY